MHKGEDIKVKIIKPDDIDRLIASIVFGVLLEIIGYIKGVDYGFYSMFLFMITGALLYDYSLWRIKNK